MDETTELPLSIQGFSEGGNIAMGFYLLIAAVLAVLGNGFVLEMFRRYRQLISPTSLLLISLAMADLGMALFAIPLPCISSFAGRWLFQDEGCLFHGFVGILFGLASIGNLAVISIDRYLVICRRDLLWSYRQYFFLIAIVWFNALIWALVPLFGWSSYVLEPDNTACTIHWMKNDTYYISYVSCVFVVCFLIPFCLMTFDYHAVYRRMARAGYEASGSGTVVANQTEDEDDDVSKSNIEPRSVDWSEAMYVTKMCIALVIVFILSWLPYATIFLWAAFGDPHAIPLAFTGVAESLSKASAFINPALYVMMNPRFRQHVGKMLGCSSDDDTVPRIGSDRQKVVFIKRKEAEDPQLTSFDDALA
ncbi:visual pigment-like receptor peropsin [Glandiceps talaboti]